MKEDYVMNEEIRISFKEFLDQLEIAKATSVSCEIKSYDRAILMVKTLLTKDLVTNDEFDALRRYISDCLSFSENVFKVWHRVERKMKASGVSSRQSVLLRGSRVA